MIAQLLLTVLPLVPNGAANPCEPLPSALREYIHQALPEYEPASSQDFDSSWISEKSPEDQTDGAPGCITGDFDGNGQRDFALVLRHEGAVVIMAFRRVGTSYRHSLAFSRTDIPDKRPLHLALFRTPPGEIHGGGFGNSPPQHFKNQNPGIAIVFFETSSVYLYWAKGRWHEIWTSD